MIYSKECEYAIRALTYLAQHAERRCMAKEIAAEEGIPYYFLSKILQNLASQGLLRSAKGPKGGFQLARPAEDITLYDIRALTDGIDDLDQCAAGLSHCSDQTPCPLHDHFKLLREQIKSYLEHTTLADMSRAVREKKALLQLDPP